MTASVSEPPVVFRAFGPNDRPAAGELYVRPAAAPAEGQRARLTELAVREGPAGFECGEGPVQRIVVKADPALDDMLAALALQMALAGERPSADARLVHYAADLARGLEPARGVLPPEDTVEGMYAHVRIPAGDPLTDPRRAEKFLAGWRKLATVLRPQLANPTLDPYRQSLFADRPEWEGERQYLRADREVYLRDVRNGERCLATLPRQTGEAAALRLTEPDSALFKYWARTDPDAPGAGGYHFLAVNWGGRNWFFSTDPVHRYKIGSLAAALQGAELARDPGRVPPGGEDPDPWYDGRRHEYTIVCPPNGGTRLADDEVWAVVREWGQVRPVPEPEPPAEPTPIGPLVRPHRRLPVLAGVTVAGVLLAGGGWIGLDALLGGGSKGTTSVATSPVSTERTRDSTTAAARSEPAEEFVKAEVTVIGDRDLEIVPRPGQDQVKCEPVALEKMPDGFPVLVWLEAPSARRPPDGIALELPDGRTETVRWEGSERAWRTAPLLRSAVPSGGVPRVTVTAPTPDDSRYDLTLRWRPNPSELHLHVMTVGVSQYDPGSNLHRLEYADDDARELHAALLRLEGPLFTEVIPGPLLIDPTAEEIVNRLGDFEDQVRRDTKTRLKLAVVSFSGHGKVHKGRTFAFLPRNYDPKRSATVVDWAGIHASLRSLHCPTLLLLDTCYSGKAAIEADEQERSELDNPALAKAINEYAAQKPGLFVLAAADRDGKAYTCPNLKHGCMTHAVLEVLRGEKPPSRYGVITLKDLYDHVSTTVRARSEQEGRDQVIVPSFPGGRRPEAIPLVYRPPPPPPK